MPALTTPRSTPIKALSGTVVPFDLTAGSSTLLCVPEGATLRTTRGSLVVQEGPLVCGQVLVGAAAARVLRAGTAWSAGDGSGAHWLRITALESTQAQLEERAAPVGGIMARLGPWAAAGARALRRAAATLAGTAGGTARTS